MSKVESAKIAMPARAKVPVSAARIPTREKSSGPETRNTRQPGSLRTGSGTDSAVETTDSSSGVQIKASSSPRAHPGTGSSGESRLTA